MLVWKFIEVEHRAEQHYNREDYDDASHHAVDEQNAVVVELAPNLVYEPCKSKPPQHSSEYNACVANGHLKRTIVNDEGKLGKEKDEEEDDKRVGQRNEKSRDAVVCQCPLLVLIALVHVLCRVGAVTIDTEQQQHNAAAYLQNEAVVLVAHEVHDKTHSESGKECVDDVAHAGSDTCNKAIPSAFVKRALYT